MRRIQLGLVMLVATMVALPASGRAFRTDLNDCTQEFASVCWGGGPSGTLVQPLPIGQAAKADYGTDSTIATGMRFSTYNFNLIAFDYLQFLTANSIDPSSIGAPIFTETRGLIRDPSSVDPSTGTPWEATDAPLLRLNWYFDFAALGGFTNVFEPFYNPETMQDGVGVQLIFSGDGFELNGLKPGGNAFGRSFFVDENIEPRWNGAREPCDTFDQSGFCIGGTSVPEPSSYALLGMGLLALTFGVRAGRPARARSA